jgi:hypothetical protein
MIKMSRADLEKHCKYKSHYGQNEVYWGLGIEEESYLQFSKLINVAAPIVRSAHKPERYSVNYFSSYKPDTVKNLDQMFTDISGFYPLPFLFNAHSFTRMDIHGKHKTTYEKVPKANPAFLGRTFFQELQNFSPKVFIKDFNESFVFDGDTIEFITQDFYKANAKSVIQELLQIKKKILNSINECCKKKKFFQQYGGKFIFPPINPGFAVFHSNPTNIAIFNNGTYHINITLPSLLGSKDVNGRPTLLDPELFKHQHKMCIRMIQWIEPFLIAMYGTQDPFPRGSKASQRGAMSRFIGIGTYDTDSMPEGKIVGLPIKDIRGSSELFWWYKEYHKNSIYNPLTQIGMDINYRKHYLHGIELRIFDWFPEERLFSLIEILVYLAETSLVKKDILEPVMSKLWNDLLVRVLQEGETCELKAEEIAMYEYLLDIPLLKQKSKISVLYKSIFKALQKKYRNGYLAKCFLRENSFTKFLKSLYYLEVTDKPQTIMV